MKLLVYDWNAWNREDFYEVLKRMRIEFDLITKKIDRKNRDSSENTDFIEWFVKEIDVSLYDAVLSLNYWEPLSIACEKKGIKYVSWSYDSPIDIKYPEETFSNKCNYIFLYDRHEAEKYQAMGYKNVYHMPLGVNFERFEKYDSHKKECDPYRAEVSFVGGLYNNFFGGVLSVIDEQTKAVLDKIIDVQASMPPGQYILDQMLTDALVSLVDMQVRAKIPDFEPITRAQLEFTMGQEVTRRERIILLNLCGKRYKTDLYSYQTFDILNNVNQRSTVDYVTQMPLVFAASKINLNPALFAIRTGISLRAFDIISCGGFLLSNYKEEYKDYFEVGKEMEIYTSMDDAIAKIDYYLGHDDERIQVIKAGRARVKSEHRLEFRLQKIFEIVGL